MTDGRRRQAQEASNFAQPSARQNVLALPIPSLNLNELYFNKQLETCSTVLR
jgi:hypothetical protein